MILCLYAWALAAGLQLVLWLVQLRTKNAGIVDVGWAGAFALVVALFCWLGTPAPIGVVVAVWSVRLTAHLLARGAATGPEEGRYKDLRSRWSQVGFFVFFQAQAALVGLLSSAFVVPFIRTGSGPFVWLGLAVSSVGVVGEAVADWQLSRFKRTQKGVCDVGLWSWSRHPNYFFEWCVWLGYAVCGIAYAPLGLVALAPQAILLGSILFVTGIPPTEAQSLRSKGDAFRAYQARVSKFVPWPPASRSRVRLPKRS